MLSIVSSVIDLTAQRRRPGLWSLRLPRQRANDGKVLVSVDLGEINHNCSGASCWLHYVRRSEIRTLPFFPPREPRFTRCRRLRHRKERQPPPEIGSPERPTTSRRAPQECRACIRRLQRN